jgi:hypothetical protein
MFEVALVITAPTINSGKHKTKEVAGRAGMIS